MFKAINSFKASIQHDTVFMHSHGYMFNVIHSDIDNVDMVIATCIQVGDKDITGVIQVIPG